MDALQRVRREGGKIVLSRAPLVVAIHTRTRRRHDELALRKALFKTLLRFSAYCIIEQVENLQALHIG
jgi:hypothetical protein